MLKKLTCVAAALGSIFAGVAIMPGTAVAASPRCIVVTSGEGKPYMESRDRFPPVCIGSADNGPHVMVNGETVRPQI